jgi:hypothetical protein
MVWASLLTGGLAGGVAAFLLGLLKDRYLRNRRISGHWGALKEEVEICGDFAQTYITDNVLAPLYRLPSTAFGLSLSALLGDGDITRSEYRALTLFAELVTQINRGLDRVASAHEHGDAARGDAEVNRLRLKCRNLIAEIDGNPSYIALAHEALAPHVKKVRLRKGGI